MPRVTQMDIEQDDRDLVLRAKDGSQEAFTDLVRKYHERIYRIAYRIVHDPDEADEITQETFSRAVTALDRFDFRAKFYTWIVSIARNAAFDALRSMQRRSRYKSAENGLDRYDAGGLGDPVTASAASEAKQLIQKALERLSVRDRTLIVLREYESLQYDEIARVMGCSVGTVESGLHRARKRIRQYLTSLAPSGTPGVAS